MILTTRPLTDRSWLKPDERKRSSFTASWQDTLSLLQREVYMLQTESMADPILMMDIQESDLRIDGQIRASARPASDAVALSFESTKGPLIFRCDKFDQPAWGSNVPREPWKHNLRAIALTMEALRKVDRYGATQTDQQYAGWRQIESAPAALTDEDAWVILCRAARTDRSAGLDRVAALAKRNSHPDRNGGDHAQWHQVAKAIATLSPTRL